MSTLLFNIKHKTLTSHKKKKERKKEYEQCIMKTEEKLNIRKNINKK